MSRKGTSALWVQVDEMAERGQVPLVVLPATARIISPRRPVGRPRTSDPHRPKGYNYPLHTHNGHRMRCRATGCRKTLRKDATSIVCSEACGNALKAELRVTLDVLEGKIPATEFPVYLRGGRNKLRV